MEQRISSEASQEIPYPHLWNPDPQWVIPCQINTGHVPTPSELNDFLWDCSPNGDTYSCQILLLYGHWIFESRHLKLSKKLVFLATSCLIKSGVTSALIERESSFFAHFKANKIPFIMTYYTEIFSTVMFSRSSNLTVDLVFLKMRYFNFCFLNILCACTYYLKHLQISSWDCNGTGFCEAFYCKESLHLYRWGNFKCKKFL
jgi:hypothetical protein